MKFSNEHYNGLKNAIRKSQILIAQTRKQYKENNLSEIRLLWDIFWASNYCKDESFRNADYLDTHIQTAIKNAIKEIELEQDIQCQKNDLSERIEAGIATNDEIDEAMNNEFDFAKRYFN